MVPGLFSAFFNLLKLPTSTSTVEVKWKFFFPRNSKKLKIRSSRRCKPKPLFAWWFVRWKISKVIPVKNWSCDYPQTGKLPHGLSFILHRTPWIKIAPFDSFFIFLIRVIKWNFKNCEKYDLWDHLCAVFYFMETHEQNKIPDEQWTIHGTRRLSESFMVTRFGGVLPKIFFVFLSIF